MNLPKEVKNVADFAIEMYTQIAELAVPVAFVWGMCEWIVGTVLRAALGGKLCVVK